MSALDSVNNLLSTYLYKDDQLRYCLVDENKNPYKITGSRAASNKKEDFVSFKEISEIKDLDKWAGIGISVQFSKVCGIDIDHCFKEKNKFESADQRAKDIFNMFKNFAYIEYSFSGTGMRVLFRAPSLNDYKEKYFIKNSKNQIEFYQPSYGTDKISYRYLTITGNVISNNPINQLKTDQILIKNNFLNKYLKREKIFVKTRDREVIKDNRNIELLKKITKHYLLIDYNFQNNWFMNAPGSGSNESERDYGLCAFIYDNITKDPNRIIELFELSNFYNSKDYKHKIKWNKNNKEYFKVIYDKLRSN